MTKYIFLQITTEIGFNTIKNNLALVCISKYKSYKKQLFWKIFTV